MRAHPKMNPLHGWYSLSKEIPYKSTKLIFILSNETNNIPFTRLSNLDF